jgi:hypothetical protein
MQHRVALVHRSLVGLSTSLALCLVASVADAQSANRSTTATASAESAPPVAPNPARDAFNDGVRALDESRFADAASAFERSYQLAPVPAVLFNLAFATPSPRSSASSKHPRTPRPTASPLRATRPRCCAPRSRA